MKTPTKNYIGFKKTGTIQWVFFALYLFLIGFTMLHHELWGDEIHSWNLAKGSASFAELISNSRYEGHPPIWYIILWVISKFTHQMTWIQVVHFFIIATAVFLLLFYSPFPLGVKLLVPFGYYFLFEFAVLSRNYAIALVFAFAICIILKKDFKSKTLLYYLFLLLLANTHLFALVLAGCIHLYFLLQCDEKKLAKKMIAMHVFIGLLVFLVGWHFISPPSDSASGFEFWKSRLSVSQVAMDSHAALSTFIPMPAWWEYNSWNSQFLLSLHNEYPVLKFISPLISFALIVLSSIVLRKDRKSLILFITNFLVTSIIGLFFPMGTERYVGFIFISFLVALWLADREWFFIRSNRAIIYSLLFIHVIAGMYSIVKDIRYPFSNFYRVQELVDKVPPGQTLVTDYMALNAASAFTDRSYYCLDLQHYGSYILWNKKFSDTYHDPQRFTHGVQLLFEKDKINSVYMISTLTPVKLSETDKQLATSYDVQLAEKIEGAYVKTDNLYLYRIAEKK